MKRLQQFEIVIEKAKEDEQEALRIYIDARTLYLQEEQKLEELRGYKDEYEKGYIKQGQQGININQINNYLSFLGKIDQSVRHQLQVIEQKKAHVEQLRENWVSQRARLQARAPTTLKMIGACSRGPCFVPADAPRQDRAAGADQRLP